MSEPKPKRRGFLRRHTVLVGAVVVFVPLLLLLRLQYGWLVKLEKTSAIAHQATLDNYLERLSTELEFWFKENAERVLNLPSSHFTRNDLERSAYYFRTRGVEGAKRLFVANYHDMGEGDEALYVFDPVEWQTRPEPDEVKAILVALSPWKLLAQRGVKVAAAGLSVDERDPSNRIILNPILDEDSRVVGVTGLILDNHAFKKSILPGAIKETLQQSFSEEVAGKLEVTVQDHTGTTVLGPWNLSEGEDLVGRRGFDFVYTDWMVGLRSTQATPESFARSNLGLNLALSGLLALVLITGVVVALRTVSREMWLSQMKSEFVSNVSHELRTPLSSIRVFGEFFRHGRVSEVDKVKQYGEYIETESRRLTQLIKNILDFSKIESGGKIYRFQRGNVGDVVDETLRTFDVRLRHEGFDVELTRPPEPLPEVEMDAQALRQAVGNLLDNAVKYSTDRKSIRVSLVAENGSVIISVRDRGRGISRDEQNKIFERFHRVSTGLVHDVKGSGLGLAIVKHIVIAHGGKVTLESEMGQGSRFSIHLPAAC